MSHQRSSESSDIKSESSEVIYLVRGVDTLPQIHSIISDQHEGITRV